MQIFKFTWSANGWGGRAGLGWVGRCWRGLTETVVEYGRVGLWRERGWKKTSFCGEEDYVSVRVKELNFCQNFSFVCVAQSCVCKVVPGRLVTLHKKKEGKSEANRLVRTENRQEEITKLHIMVNSEHFTRRLPCPFLDLLLVKFFPSSIVFVLHCTQHSVVSLVWCT